MPTRKKTRLSNGRQLRLVRKLRREKQAREKLERQKIQATALASGNAKKQIEAELDVIKKLRDQFNQLRDGLIETVCQTIKNALNTNKISSCSTTLFPDQDQNTKKFVCSVCNKKFGTSLGLAIHQKQHANDFYEMKCHACNQLFDNCAVMLTHYFDIHSFKADNEILSEKSVFTEEEERSLRELEFLDSPTCEGCLKPWQPNLKMYGIHVIAKHRDNQELLKYFSFSCSQCNTPYPSRGDLEYHWNAKCKEIWKQDKIESFFGIVCEKCGLRFTSDENLNFHTEIVHDQNKELPLPGKRKKYTVLKLKRPSVCTFCDKTFTSEDGVRTHQLSKHKKFICRVCGETVASENEIEHRKSHRKTASTVNICDICGKSLKSYVSLYVHKKFIHGGKIYLCDICGMNCNNPYALKTHVLSHSDYKGYGCSLCEVRFKTAQDFYTHRRKHRNQIAKLLKFPEVSPEDNAVASNNLDASKPDLTVTNSTEDLQRKLVDSHNTKQSEPLTICAPPLLDDRVVDDGVCPNTISSVGPSDSPEHDYLGDIDFDNDDHEIMPEYDYQQSSANEGNINNNFSSLQPQFPNCSLPNSEINNVTTTSIPKQNMEFSQATVQSDVSRNCHQQENYSKNQDCISSIENTSGQPYFTNLINTEPLNTIAEVIGQNYSIFQSNEAAISIVTNSEPEIFRNDSALKSNISPTALATQSKPSIGQKESAFQYDTSPVSIPTLTKPEFDQKDSPLHSNKSPTVSNVTQNESEINSEIFIKTEPIDEYFPLDPFSPQLIVELKKLKRYRCIPCGKTIFYNSNAELRTHRITHRKDALKIEKTSDCESFSEDYERKKKISRLKSARTKTKRVKIKKTPELIFRCSQCEGQFSSGIEVSKHCLKEHPDIKCFKCDICLKMYSTQRLVNDHKTKVHFRNESNSDCESASEDCKSKKISRLKSAGTKTKRKKIRKTPEVVFHCSQCEAQFSSGLEVSKHCKKKHPDIKCFKCDICLKMFSTQRFANDHKTKMHFRVEGSVLCELCGKAFSSANSCKRHFINMHQPRERKFVCDICGKMFLLDKHLREHKIRHTDNRSFICEQCGKGYYTSKELKYHVETVHDKVTKYKEAKRQQWLKRKMTIKFSGIEETRKKEHLFFCTHCPATFIKERGFKNHLELHDPNRKYACDICGLRYKFSTNVITHKNYVHKKNIETNSAEKSAYNIINNEVAI